MDIVHTFAAHFSKDNRMLLKSKINTSVFAKVTILALAFLFAFTTAFASGGEEHGEDEGFKPGEMIMHHISDAHQIHIIGKIYIPLPVILIHEGHVDVFMSSQFWNGFDAHGELQFKPYTAGSGMTYENHHEMIHVVGAHEGHDHTAITSAVGAHAVATVDSTMAHTVHADSLAMTTTVVEENIHATEEHAHVSPLDFSITKNVFGMLLVMTIMVFLFRSVAASYKRRPGQAPTGFTNLIEPFILFVRNEVAIPSIGKKKADKFVPFLLTVFFFIWLSNLLGLIPFLGGFNITGTLSITAVLAILVFVITSVNGNGHYWGHIFWPPGVPLPIKFILVPIEFVSIFQKPIVLMVRLTANITAGHIIILAFVSLVLLFGQNSAVAGYSVGVGAVLFMVFMFFIELLVAFLQAYVFTLLAALYFGDATQEHHHDDEHH